MKKLIAIDPGAIGGIAWRFLDGITECCAMPETETDVVQKLVSLRAQGFDCIIIEEVGGYVGGGGQPGSAMFRFGFGCGLIRGAAIALGFRIETVRPQKWQKHFSLGTSKLAGGKAAWKNKLKAEAQRRFPSVDVTLKTADALLILDYGHFLP